MSVSGIRQDTHWLMHCEIEIKSAMFWLKTVRRYGCLCFISQAPELTLKLLQAR